MLLFFRIILLIITVAIALYVVIRNSEIRLKINNLIYSSSSKKNRLQYDGTIGLYFLGSVKLINLRINNLEQKGKLDKLLNNKFFKERINRIKKSAKSIKNIKSQEKIKVVVRELKKYIIIESLDFKSYIDTENVILTSYIVGIFSAIIPLVLR